MSKVVGKICSKHPEKAGLRYSGSSRCTLCQNESTADYYQRNKARHKELTASYYARVTKQKQRQNQEHYAAIAKRFRDRHPEKTQEWSRRWRTENRSKWLANGKQAWIKRYAMICGQQLAKTYNKEIKSIYRNCPPGFEVDHIIPLRGRGVNGLHVPWNLQYLPTLENKRKSNRIEERS